MLYIGTQLAASLVTAISADPTQRNIMLALPFVFAIFIVNFPAGLIVYWITTNVWTIGQQLAVKKLYPKPEPRDFSEEPEQDKPARGKPPAAAKTDKAGAADASSDDKPAAKRGRAKKSADTGDNGSTAKASAPPNPRKKKKRSGRRR